jgi:predicted RNA-binding protein with PUA-like domain
MAVRKYWLLKTEATCYSIDDLKRDGRTFWSGIRNYQARNYIRDDMSVGDLILFHHSNADPAGIAGIARICKKAYGDHTALDRKDSHYDPKSTEEEPIWYMVDVEFVSKFPQFVSLDMLKRAKELDGMMVLKRGQRLSVMPVEEKHFRFVEKMGKGE